MGCQNDCDDCQKVHGFSQEAWAGIQEPHGGLSGGSWLVV